MAPPAIHRRRGYDGKKAKLCDLTLDETCAKCTKLEAEGLAFGSAGAVWIAIDPDDVDTPAQICEIELTGPW